MLCQHFLFTSCEWTSKKLKIFLFKDLRLQETYVRSYKYYNKRITTRDNGNVQSHDQEESKLDITINANSTIIANFLLSTYKFGTVYTITPEYVLVGLIHILN